MDKRPENRMNFRQLKNRLLNAKETKAALLCLLVLVVFLPVVSPERSFHYQRAQIIGYWSRAIASSALMLGGINSLFGQRAEDLDAVRLAKKRFIEQRIARVRPEAAASLASVIVNESYEHGLSPFLVTELMFQESSFRTTAVSHKGARGLLQLMPSTARAVRAAYSPDTPLALETPSHNVRLGLLYLSALHKRFNGNLRRALHAYNWGPTNVSRALSSGRPIPGSVRRYADKILERSERHQAHFLTALKLDGYSVGQVALAAISPRVS